jgi:hypothetical protein
LQGFGLFAVVVAHGNLLEYQWVGAPGSAVMCCLLDA